MSRSEDNVVLINRWAGLAGWRAAGGTNGVPAESPTWHESVYVEHGIDEVDPNSGLPPVKPTIGW